MKKYLFFTILLFLIEAFIALFVRDRFVRPYMGDFLVVILIYCFLRIFWKAQVWIVALSVLLFSFLVELSQYFKLINVLGLKDSIAAQLILGNTFQWGDLLAYTLGMVFVMLLEKIKIQKNKELIER